MAGGAVRIEIATGWTWTGLIADVVVTDTDDGGSTVDLSDSEKTDRVTVSATMVQVDLDGGWDNSHTAGQELVITLSKLTASPKRGEHEFTTSSRARGGTFDRLAAVDG